MLNTIGKLTERIVAKKLARDIENKEILPANKGGLQTGKKHIGSKCSSACIMMCMKDSREKNKKQQQQNHEKIRSFIFDDRH